MAEALDRAHIAREVGPDGTRISVPVSEVPRARLLLAKDGLPSGGSLGYEIFDRGDGLTASQFQQAISQTRALEGELARSIRMIAGVRAVRVHLVLPQAGTVLAPDRQDAQASVVLTTAGPARMDREGTQAIAQPSGRRRARPAVAEHRRRGQPRQRPGAHAGEPDRPAPPRPSTRRNCVRAMEQRRMSRTVEDMLERTPGCGPGAGGNRHGARFRPGARNPGEIRPGRARSNARSQQTRPRTTAGPADAASGGDACQNNLPNADAGQNNGGRHARNSGQEETIELRDRQDRRAPWCATSRKSGASAWPCWWTRWQPTAARTGPRPGYDSPVRRRSWANLAKLVARGAVGFNEASGATRWMW